MNNAVAVGLFATVLGLIGSPECSVKGPLLVGKGQQIVAIGDSITHAGGYLKAMDAVFAQQYPDLQLPPVINAGISGQKAEDLIKRFDKDVVQKKPAVVTISIGINDVWHRMNKAHDDKVLAAYTENVEKMVRMAKEAGIVPVIVTPTVIQEDPAAESNQRLKMYVEAERQIAERNKVPFVDLHALFLKAIGEHRKQTPDAGPKGFLTSDGVHMRPLGDALMATGILRGLNVPDEKIKATNLEKVFGTK